MQPTDPQWQETLRTIFRRAATDEVFRQRCLADPAGVVREITGAEPPPGIKFRFVEKPVETLFVLPPFRKNGSELTEGDLAEVAGGAGGTSCHNYGGHATCNYGDSSDPKYTLRD
jgi:hypothetical protein